MSFNTLSLSLSLSLTDSVSVSRVVHVKPSFVSDVASACTSGLEQHARPPQPANTLGALPRQLLRTGGQDAEKTCNTAVNVSKTMMAILDMGQAFQSLQRRGHAWEFSWDISSPVPRLPPSCSDHSPIARVSKTSFGVGTGL